MTTQSDPLLECIRNLAPSVCNPLPIGSLVVLFHAAAWVAADFSRPSKESEARNYRVYAELMPQGDSKYINAATGGQFKPAGFIHPFEDHYSLPGYLDQPTLTAFFAAADERAGELVGGRRKNEGRGFLSFVYMFFLLVHPFIDGNGRVARGLLDYYNAKLELGLNESVWRDRNFKKEPLHRGAFQIFFNGEARLPPMGHRDPYPISAELRPHLGRMAYYMLLWVANVARGEAFEQRPHVRHFSQLLR